MTAPAVTPEERAQHRQARVVVMHAALADVRIAVRHARQQRDAETLDVLQSHLARLLSEMITLTYEASDATT